MILHSTKQHLKGKTKVKQSGQNMRKTCKINSIHLFCTNPIGKQEKPMFHKFRGIKKKDEI